MKDHRTPAEQARASALYKELRHALHDVMSRHGDVTADRVEIAKEIARAAGAIMRGCPGDELAGVLPQLVDSIVEGTGNKLISRPKAYWCAGRA